jgi:DNA-binding winged helix-turn-helix (wHTH) protein
MSNNFSNLREFDKFRLNLETKILWCETEIVSLPPKAVEILCYLVKKNGEVLSKKELIENVWYDSFVEESNLTHHIYELRKVFKEFGCTEDFIQTVPRRGYRWTGEVRHISHSPLFVIEKYSDSQILIEEIESSVEPDLKQLSCRQQNRWWMPIDFGFECLWLLLLHSKIRQI